MAYNAEKKLWMVIWYVMLCYVLLCYIDHKVDVIPPYLAM